MQKKIAQNHRFFSPTFCQNGGIFARKVLLGKLHCVVAVVGGGFAVAVSVVGMVGMVGMAVGGL